MHAQTRECHARESTHCSNSFPSLISRLCPGRSMALSASSLPRESIHANFERLRGHRINPNHATKAPARARERRQMRQLCRRSRERERGRCGRTVDEGNVVRAFRPINQVRVLRFRRARDRGAWVVTQHVREAFGVRTVRPPHDHRRSGGRDLPVCTDDQQSASIAPHSLQESHLLAVRSVPPQMSQCM